MDDALRLAARALRTSPDDAEAYQHFVACWLRAGRRDPRRNVLAGDCVQVQLFGWDRLACNVIINGFAYQRRKAVHTHPSTVDRKGRKDVRWILEPSSHYARSKGGGECLEASWRSWARKGEATVERLAEADEICQTAREAAGAPFPRNGGVSTARLGASMKKLCGGCNLPIASEADWGEHEHGGLGCVRASCVFYFTRCWSEGLCDGRRGLNQDQILAALDGIIVRVLTEAVRAGQPSESALRQVAKELSDLHAAISGGP